MVSAGGRRLSVSMTPPAKPRLFGTGEVVPAVAFDVCSFGGFNSWRVCFDEFGGRDDGHDGSGPYLD
ncbi:hypothetical protein D3C85_1528320 [compost metagenome]